MVDRLVWDRAALLAGDAAFDRGGEERWLVPPWSGAAAAFTDAAMALGTPDLVSTDDRRLLLKACADLFGRA